MDGTKPWCVKEVCRLFSQASHSLLSSALYAYTNFTCEYWNLCFCLNFRTLLTIKYFNSDKGCLGFLLFSNIEWKRMSRKQGQSWTFHRPGRSFQLVRRINDGWLQRQYSELVYTLNMVCHGTTPSKYCGSHLITTYLSAWKWGVYRLLDPGIHQRKVVFRGADVHTEGRGS